MLKIWNVILRTVKVRNIKLRDVMSRTVNFRTAKFWKPVILNVYVIAWHSHGITNTITVTVTGGVLEVASPPKMLDPVILNINYIHRIYVSGLNTFGLLFIAPNEINNYLTHNFMV